MLHALQLAGSLQPLHSFHKDSGFTVLVVGVKDLESLLVAFVAIVEFENICGGNDTVEGAEQEQY